MERNVKDLAFLLQYENIAWYDQDTKTVRILDKRIYPAKVEFVQSLDYHEVIKASWDLSHAQIGRAHV